MEVKLATICVIASACTPHAQVHPVELVRPDRYVLSPRATTSLGRPPESELRREFSIDGGLELRHGVTRFCDVAGYAGLALVVAVDVRCALANGSPISVIPFVSSSYGVFSKLGVAGGVDLAIVRERASPFLSIAASHQREAYPASGERDGPSYRTQTRIEATLGIQLGRTNTSSTSIAIIPYWITGDAIPDGATLALTAGVPID